MGRTPQEWIGIAAVGVVFIGTGGAAMWASMLAQWEKRGLTHLDVYLRRFFVVSTILLIFSSMALTNQFVSLADLT